MKPLNLTYAFDCSVYGEESLYKNYSVFWVGEVGDIEHTAERICDHEK